MSSQVEMSVIIIYDAHSKNPHLSKVLKSLEKAKQVVLFDVGRQPIADFAQVRNKALEQASHDYVFFIDADEVLDPSSWPMIEKIVSQGEVELVEIERNDIFLGKKLRGGEASGQRLIRLGKKTKLHFVRPVHELAVVEDQSQVYISSIKLWHYSHENVADFIAKISYYSRLEAELRKEKNSGRLLAMMLVLPPAKFFWNLLIKRGYKDGVRGVIYALVMSLHSLFVRVHGWELRSRKVVR